MKKNLKNKIKKMVAGMMLACSLLTLFGGVSSDGIVPYGETVIDGVQWIALTRLITKSFNKYSFRTSEFGLVS